MKSFIALLASLAAALFLSSCTSPASDGHTDHQHGDESSKAAQPAGHNDADIAFAANMIPHHQQAVELSELVPQRSSDPAVVELAAAISAAQAPEIETMKAFLVQWDAGAAANHEGHDVSAMDGMVDDTMMTRLESLKGTDFDQLWLQSMIGHHEGAIKMADTEIADGTNADAKALAEQIAKAQAAEVDQMKGMLAS